MKKIQLPNYPQDLPNHIDVRDFELDDGRFVRVFMVPVKEARGCEGVCAFAYVRDIPRCVGSQPCVC